MQPLFQYYADQAGCGSGSVVEKLACLRKASVSALARAQDAAYGSYVACGTTIVFPANLIRF